MDPDSGGYYSTGSAFFKTSVLTITFTSFYFYETAKDTVTVSFRGTTAPVTAETKAVTTVVKKKKKKTIYLTFDDGPNKGTGNVLKIINAEQIPVTLFVIGEHVYASRTQLAAYDSAAKNELIEIANHSYSHANRNRFEKFYSVPDSVVNDFKRCADSLGLVSNIIRTPGRNIWRVAGISCTDIKSSTAAADSLFNQGYKILGWDLEWHFDRDQHPVQSNEQLMQQVDSLFAGNRTKTSDHLVLLAHDQEYVASADSGSLHRFISEMKARDEYNFETVSSYPGIAD